MKEQLQGMQRAATRHLDPSKLWDLGAKAAVEGEHIRERLIPDSVDRAIAEASSDANEAWTAFAAELTPFYTGKRRDENAQIMGRARSGDYEREAPPLGSLVAMLGSVATCAVAVWVFAIQGLIRDTLGGAIVLLAVLLLAGSDRIARGLRRFACRRWYKAYLTETVELAPSELANIGAGAAIIGVVASLRAYGMNDPLTGLFQFILVVLSGSACAFCGTRGLALVTKRARLLELEGQAQTWFANAEHTGRLDEYKHLYLSRFEAAGGGGSHALHPKFSAAGA